MFMMFEDNFFLIKLNLSLKLNTLNISMRNLNYLINTNVMNVMYTNDEEKNTIIETFIHSILLPFFIYK